MTTSNLYYPGLLPDEYNQAIIIDELYKIANALAQLEVPTILLLPQHVEPTRPQEGMVANADGTDWNPGATGAGLYQYLGAAWAKL